MAMVFGFLLPETADEELPQTIEEANSFGSQQSYLHCIMKRRCTNTGKKNQEESKSSQRKVSISGAA